MEPTLCLLSRLPVVPVFFLAVTAHAAPFYVYPDGTGDAATIQEAVDSIPAGDWIVLGDGTFTGPGNRDIDMRCKNLAIRSESLSPAATIIDCEGASRGVYLNGTAGLLRGFTIRNGSADHGGGVLVKAGNGGDILACVIEGCVADNEGGGVYLEGGALTELQDCEVVACSSRS